MTVTQGPDPREHPLRRWALRMLGSLSLALGLIGVFLPLLPTTPFILLAAACYARSSPALYDWLLAHPRFGPTIRDYHTYGAISWRAKLLACSLLWGSILATTWFLIDVAWLDLTLWAIALAVSAYILSRPSRIPPAASLQHTPSQGDAPTRSAPMPNPEERTRSAEG